MANVIDYNKLSPEQLSWLQEAYNGSLFADPNSTGGYTFSCYDDVPEQTDQQILQGLMDSGAIELILELPCISDAGLQALRQWSLAEIDDED